MKIINFPTQINRSDKVLKQRSNKKLNKRARWLAEILDNEDILINLKVLDMPNVYTSASTIGGSFMGNVYDEQTGKVVATQFIDPQFMEIFEAAHFEREGTGALHELTEAYEGGKMAIEQKRSILNSYADEETFKEIHGKAYPIPDSQYKYYDISGNVISSRKKEDLIHAVRIEFISKSPYNANEVTYLKKPFRY